ncbi:MAG: sigma-54-dependent Fis family transcriptional regulator [Desulfofustis sp.]|nr:sigma-54-dependent Fis family transcriptional regulator [Desulfofustis sp.]
MSTDIASINLIGQSRAILDVLATVKRIADFDVVVSIYGETGTGKELVARSIHYCGKRSAGPFIPVNCGALQDNLFESELFGHEKGAFTDARHEHPGLIEQADTGTLFLDEIEALSPKGQVALLRFLQDKQYRRIGGKLLRSADVRIIVASNVNLDVLRGELGQFREDLFYRLNVLPVCVPPLRERPEDIPLLAKHFLMAFKAGFNMPGKYLGRASMEWLSDRTWPGNVRELENTIQRGVLLASEDEILPEHLQPPATTACAQPDEPLSDLNHMSFSEAKAQAIEKFEQEYLRAILRHSQGNISSAARQAKKERRALGRLIKKHQINPAAFCGD